jgi:hypothetical protein
LYFTKTILCWQKHSYQQFNIIEWNVVFDNTMWQINEHWTPGSIFYLDYTKPLPSSKSSWYNKYFSETHIWKKYVTAFFQDIIQIVTPICFYVSINLLDILNRLNEVLTNTFRCFLLNTIFRHLQRLRYIEKYSFRPERIAIILCP